MVIHEEPLSESLEHYFLSGNLGGCDDLKGKADTFRLVKKPDELRKVWLMYRNQIIAKNRSAWAEENIT